MDEVMFLQVRQLGEPLVAFPALVRPLAGMRPQMDLQVGELAKRL